MGKLDEVFEVHDKLNPSIWGQNNQMKPEVRDKILEVVDIFVENSVIELRPIDILIVGSNASFNYTEHSDIDVHVVINFDDIDGSKELVSAYCNALKSSFNQNYDITIRGIEIEMYVEDCETSAVSNGIYSVKEDKWIKFPKPIQVQEYDLSDVVNKWKDKINSALQSGDVEEIQNLIDKIYVVRKQAIMVDGEYSKGNQLFKEIRNFGLLDEMKQQVNKEKSKILSLEQINHKVDYSSIGQLMEMEI